MKRKVKITIKTILGEVFFEHSVTENTIKKTVEAMLKKHLGKTLSNINLSEMDLSKIDFSNSRFDKSRFYKSSFDNSSFDNSRFYNCSFDKSSFDNSRFDKSRFYKSSFDNSSFDNSRFYNCSFDKSSFDNSSFYNSSFDKSRFDKSRFYNSRFDKSSFYNSSFDKSCSLDAATIASLQSIKADFFLVLLSAQREVEGLKQSLIEGKINGTTYEGACACLVGTIANVRNCHYNELPGLKPDSSRPIEKFFTTIKPGHTPENSQMVRIVLAWIEEFQMLISAK